jgi:hypothetical protein
MGDVLAKLLDRADAAATSPKASVTQAWADFEAAITGRRAAEDADKWRQ